MSAAPFDLKYELVRLIGSCIDEEGWWEDGECKAFVEMAESVVHYAGVHGDRYFRLTLTEVTEAEYWRPVREVQGVGIPESPGGIPERGSAESA